MDDVEQAILDAWRTVAPRLAADPAELRRRIARRRSATLARPLRAACLAVRANDTRLHQHSDIRTCVGMSECRNDDTHASSLPPHPDTSSTVTLSPEHIRALTAPVTLAAPGGTLDDVARQLGVSRAGLLRARVDGVLRQRYVEGLGGRWGHPRPILYSPAALDPAARGFAAPDPAWSWTTRYLASRLPADFPPQTLSRVAHYTPAAPRDRYRDTSGLHPEHPALDPPPPQRRRSLALPDPPPDPTSSPRFWKDGVYVGHDWQNPLAARHHAQRENRLSNSRRLRKKHRMDKGPALSERSASKGSLVFRGYRWLCPRCARRVKVLFLPMTAVNLLAGFAEEEGSDGVVGWLGGGVRTEHTGADSLHHSTTPHSTTSSASPLHHSTTPHSTTASFACERCIRPRRMSRCDPNAWNEIVAHLTGGLLYGREVKRPPWFPAARRAGSDSSTPDSRPTTSDAARKLPYTPRPNRAPSRRRPQIESFLLAGRTFRQIGAELGITYGTVLWHAQQVYRQHGVRTLHDLLYKHRHGLPAASLTKVTLPNGTVSKEPLTKEVRHLLLSGISIPEIAAWTGANKTLIYNQRQQLRKAGKKLPDARAYNGGKKNGPTALNPSPRQSPAHRLSVPKH